VPFGQNKGGSICFIVYWVKRSVRIRKKSVFLRILI
jgi:hypothetical protein